MNSSVLSCSLNEESDCDMHWHVICTGRLFQADGAATANACSPNFFLDPGLRTCPVAADRRRRPCGFEAMGWISSVM